MKNLRKHSGFYLVGDSAKCLFSLKILPVLGKDKTPGFGKWATKPQAESALKQIQTAESCNCHSCN